MKKKKTIKPNYISSRVGLLLTVLFLIVAVQTSVFLYLATGDTLSWWYFGVSFILLIGLLTICWFRIIVAYRRSERLLNRFLDGFGIPDTEIYAETALTPGYHKQIEVVEKVMRSPQLMDLNKRQAQYLALQNQINPHFLYNTLESIRGEALIAGIDSVADMTEALAKFFRYTITNVENMVSVEEEVENCKNYFSIQKYRFGDRLQLHIEYDEDEWDEIMSYRIPKLTLQPIMENAIIHGTELKVGTGNIKLSFEQTRHRLLIRISDDGVGMDEETLTKLNRRLGSGRDAIASKSEEKGGIALTNVNNRIHLLFGEEYGMHVYSVAGKGTDVEISIPITILPKERMRDGGTL